PQGGRPAFPLDELEVPEDAVGRAVHGRRRAERNVALHGQAPLRADSRRGQLRVLDAARRAHERVGQHERRDARALSSARAEVPAGRQAASLLHAVRPDGLRLEPGAAGVRRRGRDVVGEESEPRLLELRRHGHVARARAAARRDARRNVHCARRHLVARAGGLPIRQRAADVLVRAGRRARETGLPPRRRQLVQRYRLEAAFARALRVLDASLRPARRERIAWRRSSRTLRARVASGGRDVLARTAALRAYGVRVEGVARRLSALDPPRVLRAWQAEQVAWLHAVGPTATQLADALRVRDLVAAKTLSRRLQLQLSRPPTTTRAQRTAAIEFNRRAFEIAKLSRQIDRERARLEQKLG